MNSFAYQNLGLKVEPQGKYNPYTIATNYKTDLENANNAIKELDKFFISKDYEMDSSYSELAKQIWGEIYKGDFAYTHQAYMKAFFVKLATEPEFKAEIEKSLILP